MTAPPNSEASDPRPTEAAGIAGEEARWTLGSPLRAAASWVFLLAALVAVDAGWTYAELHRRTERDVHAVRTAGTPLIRYERRFYTQDEIVAMLRARPRRAAAPLVALGLVLVGCGTLALRRPLLGAGLASGATVAGAVVWLEVAPRVTTSGVVFFLFLILLSGLGIRGARGWQRLQREPAPPPKA